MGSKESTKKMRKIKPSILSQLFSTGEGSSPLEADYKELAEHLMEFSRKKLSDKKCFMNSEDQSRF